MNRGLKKLCRPLANNKNKSLFPFMMDKRAVIAIIAHNDSILLGKKKAGLGFLGGKWHIPGETLEEGESDEQGVLRGMKEELGITVSISSFLGSHVSLKNTKAKWYLCSPRSFDVVAGSDLEDFKWVPKKEVVQFLLDNRGEESVALWPEQVADYFKKN
jgi:8-oxo-dGTP pyrophosphatase MutT (NUDIX family)